MKATIRRQLRSFQGRIERRLERENKNSEHDGRPVLRGTGAMYEIASRVRATAAGGVALIQRMVQAIGLDREIDERVELLMIHKPYDESDHVTNIAYNLLAGGECLEHLELLRNDENYLDMMGARRIPDPTTAGDFFRRFESRDPIDALQDAINESRIRVWRMQPSTPMGRWSGRPVTARRVRTSRTRVSLATTRWSSRWRTHKRCSSWRTERAHVLRMKEPRPDSIKLSISSGVRAFEE